APAPKFPVAVTLEELKREPPPRGTPAVVKARNGAEISGMFVKLEPDDTIDLADVSGNLYRLPGATVETVYLPDTTRLGDGERRDFARLKPAEGKPRELAGARRVYVWSNQAETGAAVVAELKKYGALELAGSFRDADFALYFVARQEPSDPRFPVPQFYGRLYAYTAPEGKPLRVLWQRRREFDVRGPSQPRNAVVPSGARVAAELTQDFVEEHRRQAAP
ncbi:MAG TPA: hypothetical protein VN228_08540, partial [Pyrinomonadaceae bacterium]|nr:hypothetical protein [Pyrinomonadaceae bacterium]